MRVVLDTNVLISALMFGGNPREVLQRAIRGELRLCLSEEILSELGAVLQRPKFGFSVTTVNQILSELAAIAELVVPSKEISQIKDDPADNRVLECAVEAGAEYVISGDNHLLDLGEYSSIRILNPHQFLLLLG
jgi:putative PIN family toxin of toxin-antitoxin system